MANQVITPALMVEGTESAQLIGNGTAVNANDTFEVDLKYNPGVMLIVENVGGGTANVVIDAGDVPTSPLGSQGSKTFTVATGTGFSKLIIPRQGRHIKSSGKLTGSVTGFNCKITALQLPRGVSGGA